MPAALSAEERLRRAEANLREAEQLLSNEPTDSQAHGGWYNHLRAVIGHADQEARRARRQGAADTTLKKLDARAQKLWDKLHARRK